VFLDFLVFFGLCFEPELKGCWVGFVCPSEVPSADAEVICEVLQYGF